MKSVLPPPNSGPLLTRATQPAPLPGQWTLLGSLLPSWFALAWLLSKAQWFWKHNPELQFGWIMALLCAYLIWEAWEVRPDAVLRWDLGGAFLGLFGCGVLAITQVY